MVIPWNNSYEVIEQAFAEESAKKLRKAYDLIEYALALDNDLRLQSAE